MGDSCNCCILRELKLAIMWGGTSYTQNAVIYISCQDQRVTRVEIMRTDTYPYLTRMTVIVSKKITTWYVWYGWPSSQIGQHWWLHKVTFFHASQKVRLSQNTVPKPLMFPSWHCPVIASLLPHVTVLLSCSSVEYQHCCFFLTHDSQIQHQFRETIKTWNLGQLKRTQSNMYIYIERDRQNSM